MTDFDVTRSTLLARVRDSRDSESWEQFVEIYSPLVVRYCKNRGLQDADASDVSQEVMQVAIGSLRSFRYDRGRGSFRSWLLRVTYHKLGHFFDKQKRHPRGSGDTGVHKLLEAQPTLAVSREWDREYKRRLFEWAAARVRPEFKGTTWEAFQRTAQGREAPEAVAESVGMSVSAVYQAKSRVMSRLREKVLEVAEED